MVAATIQPTLVVRREQQGLEDGLSGAAGGGVCEVMARVDSQYPPTNQAQNKKQGENGERAFFLRGKPEEHGAIKDLTW